MFAFVVFMCFICLLLFVFHCLCVMCVMFLFCLFFAGGEACAQLCFGLPELPRLAPDQSMTEIIVIITPAATTITGILVKSFQASDVRESTTTPTNQAELWLRV